MADLLFITITIGFFGLALLLVKGCDRIVGPDLDSTSDGDSADGAGAASLTSGAPASQTEAVGTR